MIKDLPINYDFYKQNYIIENEIWVWAKYYVGGKLQVDFINYYMISDHGRCRSVDRIVFFINGRKRLYKNRYFVPSYYRSKKHRTCLGDSHLQFTLCKNNQKYNCPIHKLVKESFNGSTKLDKQISHVDGNSHNNDLMNLQWLTPLQHNHYDNHSFKVSGEKHGQVKLTDKQVDYIRNKYKIGDFTYKELGNEFNVSARHIGNIIKYKKRKLQTQR